MAARKATKETNATEENMTTEKTIAAEETAATEETIATEEAVAAEETAGSEESDGMVTVKVIRIFRDKETQKIHRAGETLKITEERYQEIMKAGKYLRKV
ncbi:MAG: hypothetical protein LUI87_02290 [Lachnospiraceae bacterium]|nr:hypothetical protein [Lachnospiraceae bacterium]